MLDDAATEIPAYFVVFFNIFWGDSKLTAVLATVICLKTTFRFGGYCI
jgi:hypothetical protein